MISLVNPLGLPNRSWVWTFYVITFGTQKPIADTVHLVYLATPAEALRTELSPAPCSPFSSPRPSQPFTPVATALACCASHTPWGQRLLCSASIIVHTPAFPAWLCLPHLAANTPSQEPGTQGKSAKWTSGVASGRTGLEHGSWHCILPTTHLVIRQLHLLTSGHIFNY